GREQLDVGDRGDRGEDVMRPAGDRHPELQLDFVAGLAQSLAVDSGEVDPAGREQVGYVADRLESSDLQANLDRPGPGPVQPRDESLQGPQGKDDNRRADSGDQPLTG